MQASVAGHAFSLEQFWPLCVFNVIGVCLLLQVSKNLATPCNHKH